MEAGFTCFILGLFICHSRVPASICILPDQRNFHVLDKEVFKVTKFFRNIMCNFTCCLWVGFFFFSLFPVIPGPDFENRSVSIRLHLYNTCSLIWKKTPTKKKNHPTPTPPKKTKPKILTHKKIQLIFPEAFSEDLQPQPWEDLSVLLFAEL